MAAPIDPNILRIAENMEKAGAARNDVKGGDGFSNVLEDLVKKADEMQKESAEKVQGFSDGNGDDIHDVMIAMSKADLSFRMMLEVRNKLVEAYQEVMRLPV